MSETASIPSPPPSRLADFGDAMADVMKDVRKIPDQASAFAAALPDKTLFAVLFGAWVLLFHLTGNSTFGYIDTPSVFGWMNYAYQMGNGDDQHGYFIPVIVLGLLWFKREQLMQVPKRIWWPALILVALGLFIHVVGYVVQQTRISIVGFYFGLYGLTGVVWGWRWLLATFFPCFLFAFAVPLGNSAQFLTVPLRLLATTITVKIANLFGLGVLQAGNMMSDAQQGFQFEVAAACSGIRSLTAIFLMATIVGFLMFKTWWRRALIVSSAIPLAVVSNVLRLLAIVVVGKFFGQKAGHEVHDNTILMILLYVPGIVGVLFFASWLERGERAAARQSASPSPAKEAA